MARKFQLKKIVGITDFGINSKLHLELFVDMWLITVQSGFVVTHSSSYSTAWRKCSLHILVKQVSLNETSWSMFCEGKYFKRIKKCGGLGGPLSLYLCVYRGQWPCTTLDIRWKGMRRWARSTSKLLTVVYSIFGGIVMIEEISRRCKVI